MKSYIIISQLPADVYLKHVEDVNKSHITGFTFVVIAVVQLAGGKISEGKIPISIIYHIHLAGMAYKSVVFIISME